MCSLECLRYRVLYVCRYLEEVGYSDTILDMRSKRVRSLLGRNSPEANGPPPGEQPAEPEPRGGGESLLVRQIEEQIKRLENIGEILYFWNRTNGNEKLGQSMQSCLKGRICTENPSGIEWSG